MLFYRVLIGRRLDHGPRDAYLFRRRDISAFFYRLAFGFTRCTSASLVTHLHLGCRPQMVRSFDLASYEYRQLFAGGSWMIKRGGHEKARMPRHCVHP